MLRLILDLEGELGSIRALRIKHQSLVQRDALLSGTLNIHSDRRGR